MNRFLEGKKVVDITQSVAGPTCSQLLAHLGAHVLKVEAPGGDSVRKWGPPFVGEHTSLFTSFNRGKQAVKIDLKSDEGLEYLRQRVAEADIVLQNFRPDTAKRLGIDYESVCALNPKVIYCSITGFGGVGPRGEEPAYDALMQAFSGIMHLTGDPAGEPVRTGPGVLDIGAGMLGAIGILGACVDRAQGAPGPWRVDTSLMEIAAYFLSDRITSFHMNGEEPHRMGSAREGVTPYENFQTRDGYVLIAAGTERFWLSVCDALELQPLAQDPRFVDNASRNGNRAALRELLERKTVTFTSDELVKRLKAHSVPCSRVNKLGEFLGEDQMKFMDIIQAMDTPHGPLHAVAMPFKLNGERRELSPPPLEPKEIIGARKPAKA